MTWNGRTKSLKYLGALHGRGTLRASADGADLGSVVYEIDGYVDGARRSANGRVEGEAEILSRAFRASPVNMTLANGPVIEVELSDPCGGRTAEVSVIGRFPL